MNLHDSSPFPLLSLLTLLPFAGGFAVLLLGKRDRAVARMIATSFALAALGLTAYFWIQFQPAIASMQLQEWHTWEPSIGLQYHVGIDGLGLVMLAISSIVVLMSIAASWNNLKHGPLYFSLLLFLETALFGAYTALNFLHWFLYWELSLIPAFFLIRLWGGAGRARAATQFFVYTMVGSIPLLLAFLAMFVASGSFDFTELARMAHSGELLSAISSHLHWHSFSGRSICFLLFLGAFLGFAVKTPVVPFHSWLPAAYTEAAPETTMVLTGALSKMGVYGFLRILLPIFPEQLFQARSILLWLAIASIVLPAFAAWAQTDLRKMMAYSSINHLGYCILGIVAVTGASVAGPHAVSDQAAALTGVILQLFSHGITAAALFWFVALLARRSGGLLGIDDFGGLRRAMPVFSGVMGIVLFASLGLPALIGFPGEFLIFKGVFSLTWWAAVAALPGLMLTAVFLLNFVQRVFSGPLRERWAGMRDLTTAERWAMVPVVVVIFAVGVCPQIVSGPAARYGDAVDHDGEALSMLAWTIYLSFLGAVAVRLAPARRPGWARALALLSTLAGLGIGATAMVRGLADRGAQAGRLVTIVRGPWMPTLGIEYHLAADGISLVLVLLTGIAAVAGVLFSWNVERRVRDFFALYLVLIGAVYGVFLSFDLFLLFVFYEIAIVPKYFLIAIWGSEGREYAAMKLVLYSFAGSALVLAGLAATYVMTGERTLDMEALAHFAFPVHFQLWAFPLVFVGFAVLAGMWPLHTWAPTGHAAAPTAASMLLAGVVMKLGAYGCLRVAMMLFPRGMDPWGTQVLGFASWQQVFAVLGVVGIVYGATVALVQKDLKLIVGYSSVNHMGFVVLGLMTLNQVGISGAVYQMFSHGIIASLLFAVVGRMIYDRTHTRDLGALSRLPLARMLPFAAVTFALGMMASIGLPGFSGFIAELQVLVGAWSSFAWIACVAGVGILIGVGFSWRALQAAFFGEAALPAETACAPITLQERLGAGLLIACTILLGLYPRLLMNLIVPSLNSPLFEQLRRGYMAMMTAGYPELLRLTLPEIIVAVTGLLVLALDLGLLRHSSLAIRCRWVASVAVVGALLALAALELWFQPGVLPDGLLVASALTRLLQATLVLLAILLLLLVSSARFTQHAGEYVALLLFATTAMMLLVSTQNLLLIFITIEFLSLSLYVLTAFDKQSRAAQEAGLKYFLFGGMSAGMLLFGMSLLYGLSGSLELASIAHAILQSPRDPLLSLAMVLVVAGFGFKIAAAPFHFWAPEVYQGAPTVSAGMVASSSKVASMYALFVLFCVGLMGASGEAAWGSFVAGWAPLLALVAALSMIWGNVAAIAQTSVRRLLAYSAVGHAGYMLIALVTHTQQSVSAVVYYVITYALATLGAFGVLFAVEGAAIDSLADCAGLAARAPGASFCLLIFLLSLAGVPPLAGFFAKFYLFTAALRGAEHMGLLWLVVLALAMSVVSFYYYLKLLKQVYVCEPAEGARTIEIPATTHLMLWFTAATVVILGCWPEWLLHRIAPALAGLIH